jgi:hypothetical protein
MLLEKENVRGMRERAQPEWCDIPLHTRRFAQRRAAHKRPWTLYSGTCDVHHCGFVVQTVKYFRPGRSLHKALKRE